MTEVGRGDTVAGPGDDPVVPAAPHESIFLRVLPPPVLARPHPEEVEIERRREEDRSPIPASPPQPYAPLVAGVGDVPDEVPPTKDEGVGRGVAGDTGVDASSGEGLKLCLRVVLAVRELGSGRLLAEGAQVQEPVEIIERPRAARVA